MPPASSSLSFTRRTLIVVGIAMLGILALLLLWYGFRPLLVIFGGLLLGVLLNGLSRFVQRHTPLS
jgi:hypothetical protein